ncbi:MAG: hypothetical protein BroJett015_44450 [Chloroflexota bacterium]|nr:MAG: hypothetical protein BroJett015_44450 [Chloroflexota bacterium]
MVGGWLLVPATSNQPPTTIMTDTPTVQTIRSRFEAHAARYGRNPFTNWIGRHELAAIRALTPPAPQPGHTSALDFGCGPGRVTAVLREKGYRVTGYDISPAMIALAQQQYGNDPFVTFTTDRQAIAGQWPVVVSLGVLDYYPQAGTLWQEWAALLAADGRLVVTAPNAASPLAWAYALASRFSCPAHPAALSRLEGEAMAAGLAVTAVRPAFPAHQQLGHTLVLQLQPARPDLLTLKRPY